MKKIKTYLQEFVKLYFNKRMFTIAALGYGSGIPFSLIFITYTFNLAEKGINLKDIGLFGLAGLPFTIKFLWSPLVDGFKIPILHDIFGQRRSWLMVSQALLAVLICRVGFINPAEDMAMVVYMAIIISFVSATYDIAYDAIRVELLPPENQGAGAGMSVLGYRIGMLMSGGIALILADTYSWKTSFIIIAASLVISFIATLFSPEPHKPEIENKEEVVRWFRNFIIEPFSAFAKQHKNWLLIILFAILYKIGDALLGKMINPFYQQMEFTKTEVAEITKIFGFFMTILGGIIGGWAVYKIGVLKSLMWFGIAQTVSNLAYVWLASVGNNVTVLTIVIILENITGAMGTAAFVAYLSSLCNLRFTATQYALLTSFASLGRWLTNAPSGYLVDKVNGLGLSWEWYFIITVIISIPGLIMIKYLHIKDTHPKPEEIKGMDD